MMAIFKYIAGCFEEALSLGSRRNYSLKLHQGRFTKLGEYFSCMRSKVLKEFD